MDAAGNDAGDALPLERERKLGNRDDQDNKSKLIRESLRKGQSETTGRAIG